jgi:hypothetical protein
MLTSIGKKGGSLTLEFRTNTCHICLSVSHLDELGLYAEDKISVDEFISER